MSRRPRVQCLFVAAPAPAPALRVARPGSSVRVGRGARVSPVRCAASPAQPPRARRPARRPAAAAAADGAPDRVPEEIVRVAEAAADAAAAVVRSYFRATGDALGIAFKGDDTPVTRADREAEAAMRAVIAGAFPTHAVVGEEEGTQGVIGAQSPYSWVLDPVDGTKAFMIGKPTFGTLIAVLFNGVPVLGVVDQAISGERWIGGRGWPTTLNGSPATVKRYRKEQLALRHCSLQATHPDMFVALDGVAFRRLRLLVKQTLFGGDCYAYALLASGHIDMVVEADLKIWDFMALVPVVEAAGGVITDWYGEPLSADSDGRVVASGDAKIHAQALRALSNHDFQGDRDTASGVSIANGASGGRNPENGNIFKRDDLPADPGLGHIESMTGYGCASAQNAGFSVTVHLRSVNTKYMDVKFTGPRSFSAYEAEFVSTIKRGLVRGRVQMNVDIAGIADGSHGGNTKVNVTVDEDAVRAVRTLLDNVASAAGLKGVQPTLSEILQFSEVLVKKDNDPETLIPVIRNALSGAIEDLKSSRRREGAMLELDLLRRSAKIDRILTEIEARAPQRVERERMRLSGRIKSIIPGHEDYHRLEQEIALLADRIDITEELVRLRSHVQLFNLAFMPSDEPVGQRLIFLLHEMHREATTMGCKANDAPIAHLGVLIKEEVERIREQCQNIR